MDAYSLDQGFRWTAAARATSSAPAATLGEAQAGAPGPPRQGLGETLLQPSSKLPGWDDCDGRSRRLRSNECTGALRGFLYCARFVSVVNYLNYFAAK